MFIRMGCTAFRQLHNFLETPKYFRHWMTFKILNPIGVHQGVFPTCGFSFFYHWFTSPHWISAFFDYPNLFPHTHMCVSCFARWVFVVFQFEFMNWVSLPGSLWPVRGWHRCCSKKSYHTLWLHSLQVCVPSCSRPVLTCLSQIVDLWYDWNAELRDIPVFLRQCVSCWNFEIFFFLCFYAMTLTAFAFTSAHSRQEAPHQHLQNSAGTVQSRAILWAAFRAPQVLFERHTANSEWPSRFASLGEDGGIGVAGRRKERSRPCSSIKARVRPHQRWRGRFGGAFAFSLFECLSCLRCFLLFFCAYLFARPRAIPFTRLTFS